MKRGDPFNNRTFATNSIWRKKTAAQHFEVDGGCSNWRCELTLPSHPSWMRLLNVHHNSHVWHSTLSGWSMDLRMSFTSLKTEGQHVDVRCTSEESCALTMFFLSLKRDGHSLVWHFMKQGVNTVPSQSEERRELFDTFWDKELTSNSVPSQSEKKMGVVWHFVE